MQVHPKECQSTNQVTPMTLLEPSFADAIGAIEQAKELPLSKRTHWCCSLRSIAKALDRPVESVAARWGAVALQVNQLHHANSVLSGRPLRTTNRTPNGHWPGSAGSEDCRCGARA
jgi:hypothetical protein